MVDMQYTSSITGIVYDIASLDDDHFCISVEGRVITVTNVDDNFTEIIEDYEQIHMK